MNRANHGWCRLPCSGEVLVAVVQPDLGLPGACVELWAAVGSPWAVLVGPRGLDQQPAGVMVTGLGDVPAVALLTGGVLGWDDPQPRAQLTRMRGAMKVADLADQPDRGAGRDALEPA